MNTNIIYYGLRLFSEDRLAATNTIGSGYLFNHQSLCLVTYLTTCGIEITNTLRIGLIGSRLNSSGPTARIYLLNLTGSNIIVNNMRTTFLTSSAIDGLNTNVLCRLEIECEETGIDIVTGIVPSIRNLYHFLGQTRIKTVSLAR